MAPKCPRLIRVLLLAEGEFWVAQGLDVDIAAQGRDQDGARRAFLRTIEAQVRLDLESNRDPLQGVGPAPDWYFNAYENARELDTFLRPAHVPLYIAQAISEQR